MMMKIYLEIGAQQLFEFKPNTDLDLGPDLQKILRFILRLSEVCHKFVIILRRS